MLTEKQLSFLIDKENYELKTQVDKSINALLYRFQEELSLNLSEGQFLLPGKLSKSLIKVNKGNNHKEFPFQVVDFPASLGQEDLFTFRSVVWYANFFSFSLILKGQPKENYLSQIHRLTGKDYALTYGEKVWETDFSSETTLLLKDKSLDYLSNLIKASDTVKIFKSYNLNQIGDFERLGMESFKDFFAKN